MEKMLHTDGNGVAGLLQEVLVGEVTTARRVCQSCGARRVAGEHRAYHGAGVVLRCPVCSDVAAKLSTLDGRQVVELRGVWVIDRPAAGRD
jgi:hypothetical protein